MQYMKYQEHLEKKVFQHRMDWERRECIVCLKCFIKSSSFIVFLMRNMYGIYDVLCQQLTFYAVFTLWRDCPQQSSKKNVNKDNAKFGYQISYLFSLYITFLWDISCYFITNPSKITRRVIAFTNKIHLHLEWWYVIWEETNLLICFNHSILYINDDISLLIRLISNPNILIIRIYIYLPITWNSLRNYIYSTY